MNIYHYEVFNITFLFYLSPDKLVKGLFMKKQTI